MTDDQKKLCYKLIEEGAKRSKQATCVMGIPFFIVKNLIVNIQTDMVCKIGKTLNKPLDRLETKYIVFVLLMSYMHGRNYALLENPARIHGFVSGRSWSGFWTDYTDKFGHVVLDDLARSDANNLNMNYIADRMNINRKPY